MRPKLELLTPALIARILDEAFQLMRNPGIRIQSAAARELLTVEGATADGDIVKIPERIIRKSLDTVPEEFHLYDRNGDACVVYGGDTVQFDPGSSGVHILDPDSLEHKPSYTQDLIRIVKVAEMLPQFDAQSTAVVCNEVPKAIGDLYRLYIILAYSKKPIVTGSFSIQNLSVMFEMMSLFAGGQQASSEKPQAIFDVCPTPPLIWSEFGTENLIQLARAHVPTQLVSMPLAGVAAPVTLLGSVVQHASECLSGIAIHQLSNPGAPIVWGGAPAIFDMRHGTTPMGAIETAMIDAAYAQVGKSLNVPTHAYLGASDSKVVDAQAGMESCVTTMIGALAGINMISGAGMLDFLACQSPEKLVIDAEGIAMTQRMIAGLEIRTETLATKLFEGINFKGDFLKQKITRDLFSLEQYIPSPVIDRDSVRGWQASGSLDAFERAKVRTNELLKAYERPDYSPELCLELRTIVEKLASKTGMDTLPRIE